LRSRLLLVLMVLLGGCAQLDYYPQLLQGQLALLQARQPVSALLADPGTAPQLRARLQTALAARTFASAHLLLPDNPSYRLYADIQRPYVVWNLFASPPLSLAAELSCFLIAECVAYRGYYHEADVEAYSALGWFDDPLLSSMLQAGKQAEFSRLRADYQQLREHEWAGNGRYDGWINAPL
jgi:predicted aminopeptidase